ncbi:MAG TPA: integrase core domain-containing protein [Ktedonobacteraceae bacterium]|nr:integrase core domain-containing protein [Ktedonobacteraceae bacterium]
MRAECCTGGNEKWHPSASHAVPNACRANAVCERFLGSVRRACLDYFLILHEKQRSRLLKAYTRYFNQARPHQGPGQRIPEPVVRSTPSPNQPNKVCAVPVLGGLYHDSQRAA